MTREWKIYSLVDPITMFPRYIGVTHRPTRRLEEHIYCAQHGGRTHVAYWLRFLFSIGRQPIYSIIECGTGDGWKESEKFWIALYRIVFPLCNLTDGGEGVVGHHHSDASKAKMSAASRGIPKSPEHRAKLSAATRGKSKPPFTPEHCAHLSQAMKSRPRHPHSDDTKKKMSMTRQGKTLSPEHIAAQMGHPVSDATKAKISMANKGRRHSDVIKARMSAAKMGHPCSDETRAKIGMANKTAWTRRMAEKNDCQLNDHGEK